MMGVRTTEVLQNKGRDLIDMYGGCIICGVDFLEERVEVRCAYEFADMKPEEFYLG